jgi:hypothetical protein
MHLIRMGLELWILINQQMQCVSVVALPWALACLNTKHGLRN